MMHRTHRHEPPVIGKVTLVGDRDDILAINKPASIPMHPCGSYRFNSLMFILAKEPLIENQPQLHLVHRLDRLFLVYYKYRK
jgi:23S rRNA-/tRNA-specific pseudouridylate synthase